MPRKQPPKSFRALVKDPEEPFQPRAQQESARNRASEAETRMQTMRKIWESDKDKVEVSPRVTQAILALVGVMPGAGELRYSSERGFDVRVANSRYRRVPLLKYAHDLIESGTNPHDSVWGGDVHSLPDRAAREDKFVCKLRALLCESDAFDSVYQALKAMFSTEEWVGALDPPAPGAEESGESSDDEAARGSDDASEEASPAHSPATPSTPARAAAAQPEDDEKDEDFTLKSASSSSSSDSDEADSEDDKQLCKRRRPCAVVSMGPTPAPSAEATSEGWLADIAARVSAARDLGLVQQLRQFLDWQVPQNQSDLKKSTRVEKAVRQVPALKPTCDFATEILNARFADPPPALEDFLRGQDLRRTLKPPQLQIVREAIALIASRKTLKRVLIGAGVGVGKTSAALALCAALFRGVVSDSFTSSVVVFVPGHLVGQWAFECGETLHAARTFFIPQDTPLNMDSLKAVFKPFYRCAYDALRMPKQDAEVPVLLLPMHIFNNPNLVCFLHKIVKMLGPVLVFDEPHLTCKRNAGVCGSEVADLLQVTPGHRWVATCIHVTATPITRSDEARSYLMMLGLITVLPTEVCQKNGNDAAAQCVLDALTIKPQSVDLAAVPKYSLYFVRTQPPKALDYSRGPSQVSRQLRAGNRTPLHDNPALRAALEAALYAQAVMGKSSLVYFDVKEGVKQLRAAVEQAGWPSFYFLEGDTPASVREKIFLSVMADPGAVVLFSTIALCGVGTNLGGRIHLVHYCGTPVFDSSTLRQGIGRGARPPAEEAVTAFMFLSSDSYSLDTKNLWEKKRREVAPFSGTEIAVEGARDAEGDKCLDAAELPSLVAGLYALTQDGLVLSCAKRTCFSLSAESQLQPQANARPSRVELGKIKDSIEQAIADQDDPAAAAARRRESRRLLLESLKPPEVVPPEPTPTADGPTELAPAADTTVEPAPAADERVEPAPSAVMPVEPAPSAVMPVEPAPSAVWPMQSQELAEAARIYAEALENESKYEKLLDGLKQQEEATLANLQSFSGTGTSNLETLGGFLNAD